VESIIVNKSVVIYHKIKIIFVINFVTNYSIVDIIDVISNVIKVSVSLVRIKIKDFYFATVEWLEISSQENVLSSLLYALTSALRI
jgi:hypothetical protein